jgi:hypothetical protein
MLLAGKDGNASSYGSDSGNQSSKLDYTFPSGSSEIGTLVGIVERGGLIL